MNSWEVRSINDETELHTIIANTAVKTYKVSELINNPRKFEEDKDLINACQNRLRELKVNAGEWVTPNPERVDYRNDYPWYDGIKWTNVKKVLPEKYENDGAYGLHEWLVAIGAVKKDQACDHEFSMIDYHHKTKAEVIAFAKRINKKLTELRSKKLI